LSYSHRIFWL